MDPQSCLDSCSQEEVLEDDELDEWGEATLDRENGENEDEESGDL